jgi:sugar O-acyltransferase (sialic acid O-acetyltransferase NeuD family)
MRKLIIFGVGDAAELAYYYFSTDSNYEVIAFTVDAEYIPTGNAFCGLPVINFSNLPMNYGPENNSLFIALGYSNVNKVRSEKYFSAKKMGYELASYVSSKATILNKNQIGDNCFILENNTVQPFVLIGNNVTLWSGNHIGHHSQIGDHCFIASHVVISGRVTIGNSCFIGVNATFRDHLTIGSNCVIGAGVLMLSDASDNEVYMGIKVMPSRVPSHRLRHI